MFTSRYNPNDSLIFAADPKTLKPRELAKLCSNLQKSLSINDKELDYLNRFFFVNISI